jgi:cell division protein FtsL
MGEIVMAIEVHLEKSFNNLNVVREADTRHRGEYLGVTCLFAAFLLCLLFYGWQHYRWIQNGYRLEEAQKKREQLAEISRQLRLERESLRSLERIDKIAQRELGMAMAAPGQLVILSPEAPLTIPRLPALHEGQEQLAAKR